MKKLKQLCAAATAALVTLSGISAFAAETVRLPAKSVYVLSGDCSDSGEFTTPIFEITEDKVLEVTSIKPFDELSIFRCKQDGSQPELVHGSDKNIRGVFRMSVKRGECYYFEINCCGSDYEQMILR